MPGEHDRDAQFTEVACVSCQHVIPALCHSLPLAPHAPLLFSHHGAHSVLQVDDGVLCSFSPCIEQVQRTCETLTELGFEEIRTFECLQRIYDVCREVRRGVLGTDTFSEKGPHFG